jgi:hypothetical protein
MTKFRKKPVVIEAVQYHGNVFALPDEFHGAIILFRDGGSCFIETLEGMHECRVNDWIIKGVAGEYYPCKPDIFEATYERV